MVLSFVTAFGLVAAAPYVFAVLDDDSLLDYTSRTDVADRPGVVYAKRYVILQNSRSLYRVEYEANTGDPVTVAPEKAIEGTRYIYDNYRKLPKSEQYTGGYPPLGLAPAGNWDDLGFFNLFVNDIGFTYIEPVISTLSLPQQAGVQLIWSNSQAIVTQQFVIRENDDKVLMKLQVVPPPGQTISRLVLRLKNVPALGNTAYGNPATRSNAIATASGEVVASSRVTLTPAAQHWVAYYNKDLGYSPSGLRFVPDEVTRGHVLVGTDEIHTVLELSPARQTFHFELWEMPKLPNSQLSQYLQQADSALATELTTLAAQENWFQTLPAVPALAPLHLPAALRVPTPAEIERGYLVGKQDPFEYADANTLPVEALPVLSLWGSPGQAVHGSFCLYGLSETTNATLVPTDLALGPTAIPAAQCDLRVVKVWMQLRDYIWKSNAAYVKSPELLVKNDRLSLPAVNPDGGTGTPGLITGPVCLDLKRDQAKQCLLTVDVPPTATPGVYTGNVQVVTPLGTSMIPVSLEVLPIELSSIDKEYDISIHYRGKNAAAYPGTALDTDDWITPERMAGDWRALRKIGFNTLSAYMSGKVPYFNEAYLDTIFPTIDALGFKGPIPLATWGYAYNTNFNEATSAAHRQVVSNYLAYSVNHQYPLPTFYGIDEPDAAEVETCRKRAELTHAVEVNGIHGTYMVAGTMNASLVNALDYPVMSSYYNSRTVMKTLCEQYLAAGAAPYYYWQIWGEYPKGTRLNSGYFLYASGYKGVMPFAYQAYEDNPYNEYAAPSKSMNLVYPSVDGPVATLQSEAMRAGLADLRYLVTLEKWLDAVDLKLGAGQTAAKRATLAGLLTKYGYTGSQYWGKMIYGALTWPDHQATVQNAQFDLDRRQIADLIVECRELLKPVVATERTFTNNNASMTVAGSWSPNGVPGSGETGIVGGASPPILAAFTDDLIGPPAALVVRTNGTICLQAADMTTEYRLVMEGGVLTGSGNRTCGSSISLRKESRFLTGGGALRITGLVKDAGAESGRLVVSNSSASLSGYVAMAGAGNTYSGGTVVHPGILQISATDALGTGLVALRPGSVLYAIGGDIGLRNRILVSNATIRIGASLAFTSTNAVSGILDVEAVPSSVVARVGGLIENLSAVETGRLVKTGPGQLSLMSPSNTYSGGTLVQAGVLALAGLERALGKGNVTVADGAELRLYGLAEPTWPGGEVEVLENATVRLQNDSAFVATTNVVVRNGGAIKGHSAAGFYSSYDQVRIEGRVFLHRNAQGSGANVWMGLFQDGAVPGGLVYTGTGTSRTEMAGANLYTGGTEIENGGVAAYPLKLTGAGRMPDTGTILIHSNGVMDFNSIDDVVGGLSGVGKVILGSAAVTVNEGMSPGTNDTVTGILTVTGATGRLILAAASTNRFHLGMSGDQDQVSIRGLAGLTLSGVIVVEGAPTLVTGSYTLFALAGGPLNGTLPALILPPLCTGSLATNTGNVILSLTAPTIDRTFTNNNASMSARGSWNPNGVPAAGARGIIGGGGSPMLAKFTDNLPGPPEAIVVRSNGTLALSSASMTTEHNIVMEGGALSAVNGNYSFGSTISLRHESRFLNPGFNMAFLGRVQDRGAEAGRLIVTNASTNLAGYVAMSGASNTYSGGTVVCPGIFRASAVERALGKGNVTVLSGAEIQLYDLSETTWPGGEVEVLGNATVRLRSVSSSIFTTNVVVRSGGHIKGYPIGGNYAAYDQVRIEGLVYLHRCPTNGYNKWAGTFRDGAVPGRLAYTGTGTGVTQIAGANLYTGGTAIQDGGPAAYPLQLTGAGRMPDGGEILIESNGVMDFNSISDAVGGLAGVGRALLGAAVVTAVQGVSPGSSDTEPGILTVTGSTGRLVLGASSTNLFHIRMPGNQDQVVIQGLAGLTLGGTIRVAGAPTLAPGIYTLFDLNGGVLLGTMPKLILPDYVTGLLATNSGDVMLAVKSPLRGSLIMLR